MSRNGSGVYSLPGSSFPASPSTLIESAKYNNNLNDIAAALTQSIASDGQTPITANIPFGGNKITGLGAGTLAGDSVRFNDKQQGSDIAVAASGVVTIPSEGSLFNLTAASAFNITGFSSNYNGRTFGVRFNPDKLLKLVNSSTFKLLGGADRMPVAGEIAYFQQESGGSITEVGFQPVLTMTGYTGADIPLAIGQAAIYDVSAVTTQALRIASSDNQVFSLRVMPTTAANTTITGMTLQPNNANAGAASISRSQIFNTNAASVNAALVNENVFTLTNGGTPYKVESEFVTRTNGKSARTLAYAIGTTDHNTTIIMGRWTDTTTPWSSLGTLNFGAALTGRIIVKREF